MNLLAHVALTDGRPESITGNFIADFVKPVQIATVPESIRNGIYQHRQVDAFTDRHPRVLRSISRISAEWGWFSGILIDVYYDYFLARRWRDFSSTPLRDYVDFVHSSLQKQLIELPTETSKIVSMFIESDRLFRYAEPNGAGIEEALRLLSNRIALRIPKKAVRLEQAIPILTKLDVELECDFSDLLIDLLHFVSGWKPPGAVILDRIRPTQPLIAEPT